MRARASSSSTLPLSDSAGSVEQILQAVALCQLRRWHDINRQGGRVSDQGLTAAGPKELDQQPGMVKRLLATHVFRGITQLFSSERTWRIASE